ncbi:MAG TPA: alpha/beta fold hydrolase [Phycisphaerae bacterium]|nr:alpha/beta fold hydrolase [Phycisphaerales bacterium]HRX84054.1 alpha/beta fold hydrolase [Phycisphaerae bacterium]
MDESIAKLPPGAHVRSFVSSADGVRQRYCLFLPSAITSGAALPFAVVLHGKGVNHHAWFKLTTIKTVAEERGYVVAAPNGRGKAYYNELGERDVLDIIDEVTGALTIDPTRVYVAGHSMGGWGTWYLGLRHAARFATICPMAAPVPMDLLPATGDLDPFIIHDADDEIVPVKKSRQAAAELASLGISCRYREEHGYGHDSRMISDNLPRVFDWFAAHRRHQPHPDASE